MKSCDNTVNLQKSNKLFQKPLLNFKEAPSLRVFYEIVAFFKLIEKGL